MSDKSIPVILCCGNGGYAMVFGYASRRPQPGEPVRLLNARLLLSWTNKSLFDVAINGPAKGSKLSATLTELHETTWEECLYVTPAAEKLLVGV